MKGPSLFILLTVAPRRDRFYEWLSPQAYTKHKTIGDELEFCDRNTVPEFLSSDEFQQWYQSSSNLLFCYGNRMLLLSLSLTYR